MERVGEILVKVGSDLEIVPEIMVPEQFNAPNTLASPEKRLMIAVLEDAIRRFQMQAAGKEEPHALSRQAKQWIISNDVVWPFSYLNICDTLGVDASALRKALLCWEETHRAGTRSTKRMTTRLRDVHLGPRESIGSIAPRRRSANGKK